MRKNMSRLAIIALALMLALSACGGAKPVATEAPVTGATEAPVAATEAPVATEAPASEGFQIPEVVDGKFNVAMVLIGPHAVSYTHLRAHETVLDLVCRLLLEKKHYHTARTDQHNPLTTT